MTMPLTWALRTGRLGLNPGPPVCRVLGSDSLWPCGLQPARLPCPWGFSRQEHWNGLPRPPPGDLPNPGIKPSLLSLLHWQGDLYHQGHLGSPPPRRLPILHQLLMCQISPWSRHWGLELKIPVSAFFFLKWMYLFYLEDNYFTILGFFFFFPTCQHESATRQLSWLGTRAGQVYRVQ